MTKRANFGDKNCFHELYFERQLSNKSTIRKPSMSEMWDGGTPGDVDVDVDVDVIREDRYICRKCGLALAKDKDGRWRRI